MKKLEFGLRQIQQEVQLLLRLKERLENLYGRKIVFSEGFEHFIQLVSSPKPRPDVVVKQYEQYREYLYRRIVAMMMLEKLYEHVESVETPSDRVFSEPTLVIARRGLVQEGKILPNIILKLKSGRELSIFVEVPTRITGPELNLSEDDARIFHLLYRIAHVDIGVTFRRVDNLLKSRDVKNVMDLFEQLDVAIICRAETNWWARLRDMPYLDIVWDNVVPLIQDLISRYPDAVHTSRDPRTGITFAYMKDIYSIYIVKRVFKPNRLILISKVKISESIKGELQSVCDMIFECNLLNVEKFEETVNEIINLLLA